MSTNRNATADTDEDFQGFVRATLTKIQHSQEQIIQRFDSQQMAPVAERINDLEKRVEDLEKKMNRILEDPNMEKHSPAGPPESPSRRAGPSSEVENTSGTGVLEEPNSTNENSNQPVNQEPSAAAASPSHKHLEAKFWEKLKEVSNTDTCKSDDQSLMKQLVMKQWVYISTTESCSNTDHCLCGGTNFKYLYHIKNVKTKDLAQLAGNHIESIKKAYGILGDVLLAAQAMFDRGVSGKLKKVNGDKLHFQVDMRANIPVFKNSNDLQTMYTGGIPLIYDEENDQDFLIAKAECDAARSMAIKDVGTQYKLWVKLFVDNDKAPNFTLKAEVIKAEPKTKKNEKH